MGRLNNEPGLSRLVRRPCPQVPLCPLSEEEQRAHHSKQQAARQERDRERIRHSWNNIIGRPRVLYLGFGTTFHIIWGFAHANERNVVHFTRSTNKLPAEGGFFMC